ncbi:MAG: hypothetical protein ACYS15_00585 [Planctomycetota bacterium]|jgi:hypothetical protein
MMRLLLALLVLLFIGAGVTGCEDDQSSQAGELGIQEGRRPAPEEKRPPPGPGDGGFKQGEDDQVPGEPPPPPDN